MRLRAELQAGGTRRKLLFTRRRWRAVRDLIVAADRMRDRWADGDAVVKADLWTTLHARADDAREVLS